jgi:hypothetical protein
MAEARIDPAQLQEAVTSSLKRALERDPKIIVGPILIGIIAYPDDNNQVSYKEIQAAALDARSS